MSNGGSVKLGRRTFLYLGASACTGFSASNGRGSTRFVPCPFAAPGPVRWIVPNAAGGGSDTYSRLLQPFAEAKLGCRIHISNMPGASGLVGTRALKVAEPDGRTLGIFNAPGLLVASLLGVGEAPNPLSDFDILCRVARSEHIWATGGNSDFQSFEQMLVAAEQRPLIIGLNSVGGVSFVDAAVTSHLLGLEAEFVPGFGGSRTTSLAAVRGDVDLVALSYESVRDRIVAGDLRPVLRIDDDRHGTDPLLAGVPALGGSSGMAGVRAEALGREATRTVADADALIALVGAGRVVAAPLGLDSALLECLESRLLESLRDSAFEKAATKGERSLDAASSAEARSEIDRAQGRAARLMSITRSALAKIRG